ncbi:hypothetical protein HK105_201445 [Polyrhizophydium stewartii]|uniref:Uncharacterized protein n=1 Tax=Polyrhizophydium stewartii TaxID=2732419 RepID=A0ABR4NI76_9FUNG
MLGAVALVLAAFAALAHAQPAVTLQYYATGAAASPSGVVGQVKVDPVRVNPGNLRLGLLSTPNGNVATWPNIRWSRIGPLVDNPKLDLYLFDGPTVPPNSPGTFIVIAGSNMEQRDDNNDRLYRVDAQTIGSPLPLTAVNVPELGPDQSSSTSSAAPVASSTSIVPAKTNDSSQQGTAPSGPTQQGAPWVIPTVVGVAVAIVAGVAFVLYRRRPVAPDQMEMGRMDHSGIDSTVGLQSHAASKAFAESKPSLYGLQTASTASLGRRNTQTTTPTTAFSTMTDVFSGSARPPPTPQPSAIQPPLAFVSPPAPSRANSQRRRSTSSSKQRASTPFDSLSSVPLPVASQQAGISAWSWEPPAHEIGASQASAAGVPESLPAVRPMSGFNPDIFGAPPVPPMPARTPSQRSRK